MIENKLGKYFTSILSLNRKYRLYQDLPLLSKEAFHDIIALVIARFKICGFFIKIIKWIAQPVILLLFSLH